MGAGAVAGDKAGRNRSAGPARATATCAIRDLTFGYGESDPGAALRGLSLTFARGRSYALIGRTGSGKSTLAKVLTRAVDVPPGTVFLGGTDLCDLDVEQLRRWVALVPQRTEILAGTLAENVALFDPELLDAAARALDELGLAGWIAELPDGLATRLGEGGHVLSAGQEQLVAFARILVREPHVVILDEATARLDPVTEARVQRATERLLRDRIGIVIAHRLSSVRRCDEVVVLADGAVVEAGPLETSTRFAELLATSHAAAYATVAPAGRGGVGGDCWSAPARPTPGRASRRRPGRADRAGRARRAGAGRGRPMKQAAPNRADPPRLPPVPPARTLREIFRLCTNDPRYGAAAIVLFLGSACSGWTALCCPGSGPTWSTGPATRTCRRWGSSPGC